MIFMLLAGAHFGLIYGTLKGGKSMTLWRSEVARFYIFSMVIAGVFISANLFLSGVYEDAGSALRYGTFQAISYGTTTGFASANNAFWPPFSMLLMIYLSIQCAMAGSTTGGLKSDRILLLFKSIRLRVLKLQHPNAVMRVKLGGNTQDDQVLQATLVLIGFYMLSVLVSTLFLTLFDIDLLTSFTASVASISNVGPGFGEVSNLDNMAFFNPAIKVWLSIMMIFGRLELFGLIHLFMIRSWR